MRKIVPDFEKVEPHQKAIHERLLNWARWVSVGAEKNVSAMFRQYESPQHWEPKAYRESCDLLDAQHIERTVRTLPRVHSGPLRWFYVYRTTPRRAARELCVSRESLHRNLREARQAMITLTAGLDG